MMNKITARLQEMWRRNTTGIPWLDRLVRGVGQMAFSAVTIGLLRVVDVLPPQWKIQAMAVTPLALSAAQNWLEDHGLVPAVLKGSAAAEFAQQGGITRDNAETVLAEWEKKAKAEQREAQAELVAARDDAATQLAAALADAAAARAELAAAGAAKAAVAKKAAPAKRQPRQKK